MSMMLRSLLTVILVPITFYACKGGEMPKSLQQSAKDGVSVSETVLTKVAGKRIFFGHQSVGFNILDGVSDIVKERQGARLNIVKTNTPDAFKSPVFAHSTVGENEDPVSKVSDFARFMDNGIGDNAEIAFFKFCYIDINKTTDIDKIFSVYKETMERLKNRYPKTQFVHITVPLTDSKVTVKSLIKKLLGKEDNNIKRNHFNERLIQEYGSKGPVFDLAKIESTYPDGSRSTFSEGGMGYYSLVPEYTDDGGHLNEKGRRIAAAELLKFLSEIDANE